MKHRRPAPSPTVSARPAFSGTGWKKASSYGLRIGLLIAALSPALPAFAQPAVLVADEAVLVYPSAMDQRRAELRRALTSGAEIPMLKRERQRLSPEERDALNRELRQALRGAYDSASPAEK